MFTQKFKGYGKTQITRIPDQYGQSIEEQIRQALEGKQPIEGKDAPIFTPYKEGVLPQYDIRTDRQELALDAVDKYSKSEILNGDSGKPEFERDENGKLKELPKQESEA